MSLILIRLQEIVLYNSSYFAILHPVMMNHLSAEENLVLLCSKFITIFVYNYIDTVGWNELTRKTDI